jgi:vacuolar-type H+-ATPase subunit H
MQGATESSLIEEMLEVERNACRVLEEAKEKGNQMVVQARSEARRMMEITREDLQKDREAMGKRLDLEGQEEVAQIMADKENALQRIKVHACQQRERVLQCLREMLFGDLRC